MATYTISIVIPMYNVEPFLAKCLDSVLRQTLQNTEIICVDDGSTDSTWAIAKSYRNSHDNIVLLQQPNQGAAVARNAALEIARGEFIAFMDPDDWYPNDNVLELLYQTAQKHGALICGGSLNEYVKDKGLVTQFSGKRSKCSFSENGFVEFSDYQFDYNYQRFIFNRQFLNENSIRFPPYRRFQDPPFMVDAMTCASRFYALAAPTYCYRVNARPIAWNEEKLCHLARGLRDVLAMTARHGLEDLHALEIERMGTMYSKWYANSLPTSSTALLSALEEFRLAIDEDLVAHRPETAAHIDIVDNLIREKHLLEKKANPELGISENEICLYHELSACRKELTATQECATSMKNELLTLQSSRSYKLARKISSIYNHLTFWR